MTRSSTSFLERVRNIVTYAVAMASVRHAGSKSCKAAATFPRYPTWRENGCVRKPEGCASPARLGSSGMSKCASRPPYSADLDPMICSLPAPAAAPE